MFDHSLIEKYSFETVPRDRDCVLMSEVYMEEFSRALEKMLRGEEASPYEIGYMSRVKVRKTNGASMELSWYPDTWTRFHEVSIALPKAVFKAAIECSAYDVKPCIFVSHDWLEQLYLRDYSVFALIDAIGVKQAIENNALDRKKLLLLRHKIDELAERQPEISFISFADSLILKSNYEVGYFDKGRKCSYRPEVLLHVIKEIDGIYRDVLGLNIYAVLTQGSNEYYGESLLHISKTRNHVCLNSLGVPFAELLAIESAAKKAIKERVHPPMQLYLDGHYYLSLNFKYGYDKCSKPKNDYPAIMKTHGTNYYYTTCDTLLSVLVNEMDNSYSSLVYREPK
jgi:hypothetical protein